MSVATEPNAYPSQQKIRPIWWRKMHKSSRVSRIPSHSLQRLNSAGYKSAFLREAPYLQVKLVNFPLLAINVMRRPQTKDNLHFLGRGLSLPDCMLHSTPEEFEGKPRATSNHSSACLIFSTLATWKKEFSTSCVLNSWSLSWARGRRFKAHKLTCATLIIDIAVQHLLLISLTLSVSDRGGSALRLGDFRAER